MECGLLSWSRKVEHVSYPPSWLEKTEMAVKEAGSVG